MRLHDIVWSGLSAALGSHDMDSLVGTDAAALETTSLLDNLAAITGGAALEQYGIQVVDVRIKRLNLPEQNKQSVYARMRAERERIARQYREAEKVKGQGDAEATRIYGQAYSKNPGFYRLLRTLESYRKVLDDKTTAILSSDSELLRVLAKGESAAR